ncbi:MAG: Flp family type IVb pilin [Hyphomicrobiaceae bacterium]
MPALICRFAQCERGATAVEYGLMAVLISLAIIAILSTVGSSLAQVFGVINDGLAQGLS